MRNIIPAVFIGIVFIGIISVVVIFLGQRSSTTEENNIMLTLPEEKVTDISQQIKEIKRTEEKRKEGYPLNEKPFVERNYAYDERTVDFRLVCTKPCPVSKSILDQEFAAIAYSLSTLRGLTQSDINKEILPFEVHASEDEICPILKGALAYVSGYFVDDNGYRRGRACFFYDKIDYNRYKFPYSVSVHEVTHLFEYEKIKRNSIIYEGLSEMMESFFVKGNERNSFCWQGNNWWEESQYYNPEDPHGTGRELFFELCNQYGFDYDDIPELFRQLEISNGNVDEKEFVSIINNIVGSDTSYIFKQAGVI